MVDYSLCSYDSGVYVSLEKDYKLRTKRIDNGVMVIKENMPINSTIDSFSNIGRSLSGCITASDIDNKLANIKHIGFEVTDSCNLKCTYCIYGEFYTDFDDRENKQIDITKAKLLINYLVDKFNHSANNRLRSEIMISFYGGEPLLNADFIKEIVHHTQRMGSDYIVFNYVITTNAVYLRKYIKFLCEHDFTITVSLDGSKENDAHRKFVNGKYSFDTVYHNLKYVKEHYEDYFKRKIRFNAVMHNLNNIQDVFEFFQHEFDKVPRFSNINSTGIKPELKDAFDELCRTKPFVKDKNLNKMMKDVLDLDMGDANYLQNFIFQYSRNIFNDYNDLLIKKDEVAYLPTATCIPFSKRIFMTVNNKILPCERIGHQYSLGEVTDEEVNIDCDNIAKKYNEYYDSLRRQCAGCFNKHHCTQCMFDIQNLIQKPVCKKATNKKQFSEYLSSNMDILANNPEWYKRILEEILIVK